MTKLAKYYLIRLQRSNLQLQEEMQNRQKLEARLQTITDQIPGALYTYVRRADGSDYIEYTSEGFKELTGISTAEVMANVRVLWERLHPEDWASFWQAIEESAADLKPLYTEWRLILPSEEIKWLSTRSRPTRQPDGSTVWQGILTDISDRKQAEIALQESETINRALLEAVPDLLIRMRQDGTYLTIQSTGNVTLLNPDQLYPGTNIFNVLPGERATERMGYVKLALQTRSLQIYEYQLEIDGIIQYEEARIVPCGSDEVLVMIRDISARKRAEEQLRAEHEFRVAIERAIVEGLIVIDNYGRQSYVNPAFCEMVGWSAQELLGKKAPFAYWNPEDLEGRIESFIQCQSENRAAPSRGMELQFQRRNGEKFDVLLLDSLVRDANGKVIAWLASVYDITERKRAEAALRRSADRERMLNIVMQQVRQSLDLNVIFQATTRELRRMLECDRVVVYRFNADWSGGFVAESVGEGWTSLIEEFSPGEKPLEIQATSTDRCILRDWTQALTDTIDTHLQKTEGGLYRHGMPFTAVADIYQASFSPCYRELLQRFQARAYLTVPLYSGKRLWGLLASYYNTQPHSWEESEIQIACQIGTQLGVALQQAELFAQLKQQSEELRQARDVAEAANRAKSLFLANMSHELRTPLNAILGFTELLSYDPALPPEQQENIRIVHRNGGHLLSLINDILDLSKIEAGRVEVNETSFNLPEMAQALCLTFKQRATTKGLHLNLEIAPQVPQFVTTDSQKLRQILMNLLGNALKFTQRGSVTLHIQVREDVSPFLLPPLEPVIPAETLTLQFAIEDTGVGIAPEEQILIFEAFNQAQNYSVPTDGTGLGLTISRQFAHLLGGDITVQSTLGVGSQFILTLPVKKATPVYSAAFPHSDRVLGLAPDQPRFRILVVDDQPDNRRLVKQIMLFLGLDVWEASDGMEAIQIAEQEHPDLIWMDVRMLGMDGYEATQRIRALEREKPPVIIAITAQVTVADRQRALASGFDDYVGKPCQEQVLFDKLAEHLGVQYLYAPLEERSNHFSEAFSASGSSLSHLPPLTPEVLSAVPNQWLSELEHAVLQCDEPKLYQLIEQIPEQYGTLAHSLAHFVNDFRFEEILQFTRSYRP